MQKRSANVIGYTISAGTTGLISRGALAVAMFNNTDADISINGGVLAAGASLNLQYEGFTVDEVKYKVPTGATGELQIFELRPVE